QRVQTKQLGYRLARACRPRLSGTQRADRGVRPAPFGELLQSSCFIERRSNLGKLISDDIHLFIIDTARRAPPADPECAQLSAWPALRQLLGDRLHAQGRIVLVLNLLPLCLQRFPGPIRILLLDLPDYVFELLAAIPLMNERCP